MTDPGGAASPRTLPEPAATIFRLTEKLQEDLAFAAPEMRGLMIERRLADAYAAGEAAPEAPAPEGLRAALILELQAAVPGTCDWGRCDNNAMLARFDPAKGWLPVCQWHIEASAAELAPITAIGFEQMWLATPPSPADPPNLDYESEWYRQGWKAGYAAAQEAPAPEGLRAIVKRLVSIAAGHTPQSAGDHNIYTLQLGERFIEEAREALRSTPPTPAEPPRPDDPSCPHCRNETPHTHFRAEARPPEGLDAAWAAAEAALPEGWDLMVGHTTECRSCEGWWATANKRLTDPPHYPQIVSSETGRPRGGHHDVTPAAALLALAARLSAGEATKPDRSDCPKCGEWRDSPTGDCAACGFAGSGSAGGATLGNRPDVATPRVAKATRGAKGAR